MVVSDLFSKFLITFFFLSAMSLAAFAQVDDLSSDSNIQVDKSIQDNSGSNIQVDKGIQDNSGSNIQVDKGIQDESVNQENWLDGMEGRPKAEDSAAVLPLENEIGDEDDSASLTETKTKLRWVKKHGVWVNGGFGYSTLGLARPARHFILGYDKLFFAALEMGLYARIASLTYIDSIYFENTGYTENRKYEISSLLLGPHLRYRLVGKLGLVVGAGVSVLQSKLKSVSTTAPLPSSLTAGETTTFPLDIGYDLGFYYRYKVGPFRVGAELGYTINSLKPENAVGEFYLGLHIEYYIRGIIRETVEVSPFSENEELKNSSSP
jgi:hypothetical protein